MNVFTISFLIAIAYVIAGFMWYGIFVMSWEILLSLIATCFLLAIYETACNYLFNTQPTPMDKSLADADPSDFYEI